MNDNTVEDNTILNAIVGGILSIVLSFIPFSPIIGGGLAGYLEKKDGLKIGAISGLIASVPIVLFLLFMSIFFTGYIDVHVGLIFIIFIGIFAIFYTIVLSALGGYLGVYLHKEKNKDK